MRDQSLDALIVLGGGPSHMQARCAKAAEIYREYDSLPIVASGSHSGVYGKDLPKGTIKECYQMLKWLRQEGVKESDVELEEHSLDTLGNFIYSQPLLPESAKNLGIVTSPFHMLRSYWTAQKVMPDMNHYPIGAEVEKPSLLQILKERIIWSTLKHDLKDIKPGNKKALEDYLLNRNLMYNPQAGFSYYNLLVRAQIALTKR